MNPEHPISQVAPNPPAEEAATPPCPHFGPCGGCQLQNLTYAAQLDLKAARLRTLLAPPSLSLPEIQTHPSPPLAYRNRIRLTLAQVDGQLRAGYIRSPESQAETGLVFLSIAQCPIAAPILWHAAEAFLALANRNLGVWLSTADQLELFTTADESRLNLTLYLRTPAKRIPASLAPAFTVLCEALHSQIPELTGAGISLLAQASTERSRRSEAARPGPTWRAPGLNYSVSLRELEASNPQPATYWVPRGSFFQVNRFLLPELLALVTARAAKAATRKLAWDLYAGVGLFSQSLARSFAEVTAVEIAEPAATALAATKLPNLRAVKATTLDFLRAAVLQRERPDLIVLDPPRTGAGHEICALLGRVAAPTLIYVSCSPETLPRDLEVLTGSGYAVAELHLLDLFPQTTHIETLAILTR
jgi:23S rRNA (uracil1939-C5)-methyltransferase